MNADDSRTILQRNARTGPFENQSSHHALDDFAGQHNALELLDDRVADIHFLANDAIALVLRVVGIAQLSVGPQLKLEKFVAKLARVANAGADAERARGGAHRAGISEAVD